MSPAIRKYLASAVACALLGLAPHALARPHHHHHHAIAGHAHRAAAGAAGHHRRHHARVLGRTRHSRRHVAFSSPLHRHAALCRSVMVRHHWVQHCRG
jgi:hypothetical protein